MQKAALVDSAGFYCLYAKYKAESLSYRYEYVNTQWYNTQLFSVHISTKLNKHLKTAKLYDQTIKYFLFSPSFFMKN